MNPETRIEKLKGFFLMTPDDPFLLFALSMEYVKLGRKQDARTMFEKLVDQHSNYEGTYYHYGKFLEQEGEVDKAIGIYEMGLKITKEKGLHHANKELKQALILCKQENKL